MHGQQNIKLINPFHTGFLGQFITEKGMTMRTCLQGNKNMNIKM